MDSGDKSSAGYADTMERTGSLSQLNFEQSNYSLHTLLTKLSIPIACLDNSQIRRHYLEEYTAKYSKAKHLLNNARKKQRKIIIMYYEEKDKQGNVDELQAVKESLLEENEKIKKFKDALKDKLVVYQQRIKFLKDTEFWSALNVQQLYSDSGENEFTKTTISNLPQIHLDQDKIKSDQLSYTEINHFHMLDDSYPMHDEISKEIDDDDDSRPSAPLNEVALTTDNPDLSEFILRHREQSTTRWSNIELSDEIEHSVQNNSDEENIDDNRADVQHSPNIGQHQFLINYCRLLASGFLTTFDRFKIIGTIMVIGLAVMLVIFFNYLLEYLLTYLTKSSESSTLLMPSAPLKTSLFTYLFSHICNWTTAWLRPFFGTFKFAV